jgi:hypothetical protein
LVAGHSTSIHTHNLPHDSGGQWDGYTPHCYILRHNSSASAGTRHSPRTHTLHCPSHGSHALLYYSNNSFHYLDIIKYSCNMEAGYLQCSSSFLSFFRLSVIPPSHHQPPVYKNLKFDWCARNNAVASVLSQLLLPKVLLVK